MVTHLIFFYLKNCIEVANIILNGGGGILNSVCPFPHPDLKDLNGHRTAHVCSVIIQLVLVVLDSARV